jgi:hypothetical protein
MIFLVILRKLGAFCMYDYKIEYLKNEHNRQFNSVDAWIYIGIDTDRLDRAKIGLTTGQLGTRATSSQNTSYTLLVAFKVKEGVNNYKIKEIERNVLKEVQKYYKPIYHYNTGRQSEWFYGKPEDIRDLVNDFLYENYSWEMNCYYCDIRERGVIYGWENRKFLYDEEMNIYEVNDISNPPENPDCYNQDGCGDVDCEKCSKEWFLP